MPSVRHALVLSACAVLAAACDSTSHADPSAPTQASGGAIVGKVLTQDGRPIEKATVSYDGWPEGALGTMVNGRIASPANGHVEAKDGRYEIKVPPGQYTTEATATVKWHDKDYSFQLETADGSDDTARVGVSADKGVARDYVWKMTGTRRGRDPSYVGSGWDRALYGASVGLDVYQSDGENYRPTQPDLRKLYEGGSIELTLAPKGKLIDGSEGKTIVEKIPIAKAGQYGFGVRGIPVGDYALSAKAVKADGTSEPLRVSLEQAKTVGNDSANTRVPWAASVDLVFAPEEGVMAYYGTKGVTVYVGK